MNQPKPKVPKAPKRPSRAGGVTRAQYAAALAALEAVSGIFGSLDPAEPGAGTVRTEGHALARRALGIALAYLGEAPVVLPASILPVHLPPGAPVLKV